MHNLTEVGGIELNSVKEGGFESNFLMDLEYPHVSTMNCDELCECVACGHGNCASLGGDLVCAHNSNGHVCKCSYSAQFSTLQEVIADMATTGMACRSCYA